MSGVDTCNVLLDRALAIFRGQGGINDQLAAMPLNPFLPPVAEILKLSAPVEVYEKIVAVKYPVLTIYCERLRNTLTEKFRSLSGSASLVVDIRVSGARAEVLDRALNSYVEAACQVLNASRGQFTEIGTYSGAYDVKFQPMRMGGKQFIRSAHIEFDVQISK